MQVAGKTGRTDDPMLVAISKAEMINKRSGGVLIAPWEVDQLPDMWLDAYQVLSQAQKQQAYKSKMESYFMDFRRKHPTYRKYRH